MKLDLSYDIRGTDLRSYPGYTVYLTADAEQDAVSLSLAEFLSSGKWSKIKVKLSAHDVTMLRSLLEAAEAWHDQA